jgi:hypothetical protein
MLIVMSMSSYAIEELSVCQHEHSSNFASMDLYSPLALGTQMIEPTLEKRFPSLPISLATTDIDVFLRKMSYCEH